MWESVRMGGHFCGVVEALKPAGGMVLVQVVFAGVNLFYKLAMNDGMDMRVLVAYRYLFATVFLGPLAFFLERKSRPKLTWTILMQAFLCGLLGGTLAQNLYLWSMQLTSAMFISAMTNLIPAITFIMAVLFRLESFRIHTISGQAKILGTLVGIGGAMLLTFYKGIEIKLWSININLLRSHHGGAAASHQESANRITGTWLAVASCFCYAAWLIIQAKMSQGYPCHYSSTALMCLMATIQTIILTVCIERDWSKWRMRFDIRLLSVLYTGIVASGLIVSVVAWCIKRKGPLYASIFNPLTLVIVALLSSLLLNEKLHLGSIMGAALIVVGLYTMLWGKGREAAKVGESPADESVDVVIVSGATGSHEESLGSHGPSESKQSESPSH